MTEQERDLLRQEAEYRLTDDVFGKISETVIELLYELDVADRAVESLRKQVTKKQNELCEMDRKEAVIEEEVESLKQDCKKLMELSLEASSRIIEFVEENQRLRKALEEIANTRPFIRPHVPVQEIARQALGEEKG